MASNYPASLDNFDNPDPGTRKNVLRHSGQHSDNNDAVEAIQRKLGVGESDADQAVEGTSLRKRADGTTGWDPVEDATGTQARVDAHAGLTEDVHGIADTSLLETTTGAQAKVDAHDGDTTDVHGIADTSLLETETGAQEKADTAASAVGDNLTTHEADGAAHGATSAATADTVVRRDADAQAHFGEPVQSTHAATKSYVDALEARVAALEAGGA